MRRVPAPERKTSRRSPRSPPSLSARVESSVDIRSPAAECRDELAIARLRRDADIADCHAQAGRLREWARLATESWHEFLATYRRALFRAAPPSSSSASSSPASATARERDRREAERTAFELAVVQFLERHRPLGVPLGRDYVTAGLGELLSRTSESCDLRVATANANLRITEIRCNALSLGASPPASPSPSGASPSSSLTSRSDSNRLSSPGFASLSGPAARPPTPSPPPPPRSATRRSRSSPVVATTRPPATTPPPPPPTARQEPPPSPSPPAAPHVWVHARQLDREHAEAQYAAYVTTRVLGRGGFGVVHEACRLSDAHLRCQSCAPERNAPDVGRRQRCPYAIKVISLDGDADGSAEEAARRDVFYLNYFADRRVDGRRVVPRIYDAWMQMARRGSGLAAVLGESRHYYIVMERFDGDLAHLAQRRSTLRLLAIVQSRSVASSSSQSSDTGSRGSRASPATTATAYRDGSPLPLAATAVYDAAEIRRMFRIAAQLGRRNGDIKPDQFLCRRRRRQRRRPRVEADDNDGDDDGASESDGTPAFEAAADVVITDFGFVGTGDADGAATGDGDDDEDGERALEETKRAVAAPSPPSSRRTSESETLNRGGGSRTIGGGGGDGDEQTESKREKKTERTEPVAMWGWPGTDAVRQLQCPASYTLLRGAPAYVNVLLLEASLYVSRPVLVRVADGDASARPSGAPKFAVFGGVRDLDRDVPSKNLCRNYTNKQVRQSCAEGDCFTLLWRDLVS